MNKGMIHPTQFNTQQPCSCIHDCNHVVGKLRSWWRQNGICSCCERDNIIVEREGSYKGKPIYWCRGCMNAYDLFYKEAERIVRKEKDWTYVPVNFYSDFIAWTHQEVLV